MHRIRASVVAEESRDASVAIKAEPTVDRPRVPDPPIDRGVESVKPRGRPPKHAPAAVVPLDVRLAGKWRATCALSMPLLQAMQSVLRRWQGANVVVRFDFDAARLWVATEESFCTTMVLCATGVELGRDGAVPDRDPVLDVAMRRSLFHDAAADNGARLLLAVEEGFDGVLRANLHIPVGASRVCSTVLATRPRVPPRFPFETALLDARGAPVHTHSGAWLCLSIDAARWATARAALPASSTTAVFVVEPVPPLVPVSSGRSPERPILERSHGEATTPGLVRIDVRTGSDDQRVVELECAHVGQLGPYEAHPFPTSTIKLLSDSVKPLRLCFGPPLYRAEGAYGRARAALIAQATPYVSATETLELAHVTHNADIFEEPETEARTEAGKRARDDEAMHVRGERLMKRIANHRSRRAGVAKRDRMEEEEGEAWGAREVASSDSDE